MKHRAGLRIHEEIKNMSVQEKITYWADVYNEMIKKRKAIATLNVKQS
jgi:hypothetical protein